MGAQTAKSSPPSGTGHVPGFGESFDINLNTGQGVYSYKIALPDGVAKHTPALTLEYSSSHNYGNYGWGWDIGVRKISRKLDSGVSGALQEIYLDSGQEIVPMADGTFRNRFESVYNRYEHNGDGWLIRERNGIRHELGTQAAARISDPDVTDRVFHWLVEKSVDTCGNEIRYQYQVDENTHYLDSVSYAIYRVKFHYQQRPDARINGRMGFLAKRNRRCQRIELQVRINGVFVVQKSWTFQYSEDPVSGISQLASIHLKAHGDAADGSEDVKMPAVTFQYREYDPLVRAFDFINTDGSQPPPALTDDEASLINMANSPLPGMLSNQNGTQHYWENDGMGNWLGPRPVSSVPFVSSFTAEGAVFGDMDASGNADMLVLGPNGLNGYYENRGDMQWSNFVAYPRGRRAFPSVEESTRFVDIDGNGVVDAIRSTRRAFHVLKNQRKDGWGAPAIAGKTGDDIAQVSLDDLHYHLADMTGDGLMDIVKLGSGRIDYWPSLGNGKFGDKVTMFSAPRVSRLQDCLDQCFFADINGSGCADLMLFDGSRFVVCYNRNGMDFSAPFTVDLLPPPVPGTLRAIDFYGNGKTGLLYNTWSHSGLRYAYVTFGSSETSFDLAKVVNGFGLESEIFYEPAIEFYNIDRKNGQRWKTHFPFSLRVVSGMKETDVITGLVSENEIIYHDAHFNADLRQFQGFGRVEKIEKGDDSCPDKKTIYHYLMAQEFAPGNRPGHAALNGKMHKAEVFALDGSAQEERPYTIEESRYVLQVVEPSADGHERVAVLLDSYTQTHLERSDDRRIEEKKYQYDAFGNATVETLTASGIEGGQAVAGISSEIRYQYAINEAKWILDRVAVVAVFDKDGKVTGETRKYYDGNAFEGLPLGQVDKGLEVREARLVMQKTLFDTHYGVMDPAPLGYREDPDDSGAPAIWIDFKRSEFDAKGLRIGEMDAMGNAVQIQFSASGLFRRKYISNLGENSYEIDQKLGAIKKITGPDGSVLRMGHDAMGRLREVFTPDNKSAIPSRTYQFDDSTLPFRRITKFYEEDDLTKFSMVITYFDGASSEIQNRLQCDDNKFTVSEYKVKNPLGKVKLEHQPYFSNSEDFDIPDSATNPHQLFSYDVMGRPVRTVNFFGGVSTATYRVFEVRTSDPIDNETDPDLINQGLTNTPKIERFNVLRDRTETIQKLENNAETTMQYHLSDWGQLEALSDDKGTVATYIYDYQGNRLSANHREGGLRKVWFNALRQPVKGEDANTNIISAEYDGLNRLSILQANGVEVETYTYDTIAANAIGRLAAVQYEKGTQSFVYDDNGRVIRKTYDFADRANPLEIKYTFNRLGRRTQLEHGDGTKIEYHYTPNGWVKEVPGLVTSISSDPMGNPTEIRLANDVVTQYSFFDGGRKIKTQRTVNKNNQVLENLEYEYFSNGSVRHLLDKTTNKTATHAYKYNALNEILEYGVTQDGNISDHVYEYADHLNLRSMGDNGFTMFRDDPAVPAHISRISDDSNVETILNYDNNGNLLNLPGRAFTYSYKNAIARLDRDGGLAAEYFYNHREERVQKTVTDGPLSSTTFFIENLAEYKDAQQVFFVYLGNIRVAMIQNGTKRWIHSNYLGNTSYYTDNNGTKITSIAYKPFGNIAGPTNNLPAHTFGTHPFDEESGLYYANKRYYAPEIGCFMSPDAVAMFMPKKVIGSIKAFQCYTYTGNDPANNVDLSGMSFWSVFGAIVGAIVGIALVVFAGPLLALIIGIAVITLSYVLASNNVNNDFGEFMRGFMIGFNAGMNAAIGTILFGPVIGIALGVINFLAAFDSIAQNDIYKGILGWASWLMPMSWVVTGLGLIFFVINLIVAGVTFQQVDRVKIHSISVNWQTGMIIMEGGLITYPPGGFNMGNFSFYGEGHTDVIDHELGHGLSLGAFGWVFHFIGAIDENLVQENMHDAYSEHLAESNQATPDHPPPTPALDMWTA